MFTLPKTELLVHPLCLGANVFGWSADEAQSTPAPNEYLIVDALLIAPFNSYFL